MKDKIFEEPNDKNQEGNNGNQIANTKESPKVEKSKSDGIHDELKIRNQQSK